MSIEFYGERLPECSLQAFAGVINNTHILTSVSAVRLAPSAERVTRASVGRKGLWRMAEAD